MFKTKKQLRSELDYAVGKCSGLERSVEFEREVFSLHTDEQAKMMQRLCEYIAVNAKLKHDLNTEIRQKEEISEMLAHLTKKPDFSDDCPADCKNRQNQDVCRLCTRYPAAKDRYEVRS